MTNLFDFDQFFQMPGPTVMLMSREGWDWFKKVTAYQIESEQRRLKPMSKRICILLEPNDDGLFTVSYGNSPTQKHYESGEANVVTGLDKSRVKDLLNALIVGAESPKEAI